MDLMSSNRIDEPIRVGLLTDEPLRMEGLIGIFDTKPGEDSAPISPVFGNFEELLSDLTLLYLIVDLHSNSSGLETVETIRRRRPDMRLIVIGPERDDKQILGFILAGARAYLDQKANQRIAHQALDVVVSGSIWAPRRLLSLLIDKLLSASDASPVTPRPRLTDRERQVLELILTACPNREIARQLGIEESTVQGHVGRLLRKTGADNRIGLLMSGSNPALLETAEIRGGHREERRQNDHRQ
jgi:DNA-binding NarL/FixJ family response regulator